MGHEAHIATGEATKRQLAQTISPAEGQPRSELFRQWHESMHETADALVERARRAGALAAGVTAADLLAMANGIALAAADAPQAERLLDLLRRGTQGR